VLLEATYRPIFWSEELDHILLEVVPIPDRIPTRSCCLVALLPAVIKKRESALGGNIPAGILVRGARPYSIKSYLFLCKKLL
jgi:hypothetical protein